MRIRTLLRTLCEICLAIVSLVLTGCFSMYSSAGGGETTFIGPRQLNPKDIALPAGYRIESVVTGLTFPTGVTFDDAGRLFIVESGYSYGEVWTAPRLLRVEGDGKTVVVATGARNGPWTGVTFHAGNFYIAEGGHADGGRILKVTPQGRVAVMLDRLPSVGDHHTDGPLVGPDGWLYFAQGTATNSGVVGTDNAQFGWLKRHPEFHDTPCRDIRLAGENFTSRNPLVANATEPVTTGAFSPFGKPTAKGQIIPGQVPCNGAVMRLPLEGGKPELVAWGFRNPFGLAFSPSGRLYVTDNSYDVRGSRPVFGTGDLLWEIQPGTWYGWPDYHGSTRLDRGDRYVQAGQPKPRLLLMEPPGVPPTPAAIFDVHSSSNGLDFSRRDEFGYVGQAFVAQFGDMAPPVGKVLAPVGYKIVRVDVNTGIIEDFAVNRGPINGPATWLKKGGLERPVAARFNPSGTALYIVDFGVMTVKQKPEPQKETGVLWRITKAAAAR
jgi:glucose/arabinose dehydrogenase